MHLGTSMNAATTNGNGVILHLSQRDGTVKELHVDHVIAATGYKVKLQRLGFLDPDLRGQMKKWMTPLSSAPTSNPPSPASTSSV